ncbi:MAG: sulfotransferase [Anaerolineales bacterium]|nr:MAG: sulfotransferase [Anaerolineales bacterium]
MKRFLQELLKPTPKQAVTIVSGLPRSGTSMLMKMLEAGGIPPLTDQIRTADGDNPKGYYEFERVKKLDEGDTAWLEEAQGKAVKVISALLKYLPQDYTYKMIFMRREIEEILASQRKMLVHRGEPTDTVSDDRMKGLFIKHLAQAEAWMNEQPNIDVIYVSYNDILQDPVKQAKRINQFLGNTLDVEKMAGVVDQALYRQRQDEISPQ